MEDEAVDDAEDEADRGDEDGGEGEVAVLDVQHHAPPLRVPLGLRRPAAVVRVRDGEVAVAGEDVAPLVTGGGHGGRGENGGSSGSEPRHPRQSCGGLQQQPGPGAGV